VHSDLFSSISFLLRSLFSSPSSTTQAAPHSFPHSSLPSSTHLCSLPRTPSCVPFTPRPYSSPSFTIESPFRVSFPFLSFMLDLNSLSYLPISLLAFCVAFSFSLYTSVRLSLRGDSLILVPLSPRPHFHISPPPSCSPPTHPFPLPLVSPSLPVT